MRRLSIGIVLVIAWMMPAPLASADMPLTSYELLIPDRYDFHTWIRRFNPCDGACVHVNAVPRPVAKAFPYRGDAQLINGRYVIAVDVPDGLRCDNVYYGPTIPTHDVYTWDPVTLTGSLDSSSNTGCDGLPGGMLTYPFTLSRL